LAPVTPQGPLIVELLQMDKLPWPGVPPRTKRRLLPDDFAIVSTVDVRITNAI